MQELLNFFFFSNIIFKNKILQNYFYIKIIVFSILRIMEGVLGWRLEVIVIYFTNLVFSFQIK